MFHRQTSKLFKIIFSFFLASHCSLLMASPIMFGKQSSMYSASTGDSTTITIQGVAADAITIFDVPDPQRIVVDMEFDEHSVPKTIKSFKSSCIKSIRFGTHEKSLRMVLDMTNVTCSHEEQKDGLKTVINISRVHSKRQLTPTVSPTVSPTAAPKVEPTTTLTPIRTEIPATLTPIPPTPMVATPITTTTLVPHSSKSLKTINFLHENDQPILKLELSERMNFKLTRDSARQYRISINDCDVENKGLTLPQFPPNDMAGFTLVQAVPGEGKLEIIIGLDDGMKAYAYNRDSTIIIRAQSAGF